MAPRPSDRGAGSQDRTGVFGIACFIESRAASPLPIGSRYLERRIAVEKPIGKQTVVRFKLTDIGTDPDWRLASSGEKIDSCVEDPVKELDVYFTRGMKTIGDRRMGGSIPRAPIRDELLKVVGAAA